MDSIEISLKFTVAQINVILTHLSRGAYAEVNEIINLLHAQAKPQVDSALASKSGDGAIGSETAQSIPAGMNGPTGA
jgi:hypothetical protein